MRHCSAEPGAVYEPQVLIADMGEAKALAANTGQPRPYGTPDNWAPEIESRQEYSKASDVYAFGHLVWRMVQKQWKKEEEKTGVAAQPQKHHMPVPILTLLINCWQKDPEDRPTAESISDEFDDLEREWYGGNHNPSFIKSVKMDIQTLDGLFTVFRGGEVGRTILGTPGGASGTITD